MKNNTRTTRPATNGFAPIFIFVAIVIIGGGTYAVVQRDVLKSFFEKGDKPNELQFADTIDSSLNIVDDADRNDTKVQQLAETAPQDKASEAMGSQGAESKQYNPTTKYEVGDTALVNETIYQARVLKDEEVVFTLDKVGPVTFRWTPVVPKPQSAVTYRLKVWQLMQGQTGAQAMKTNMPVVTKDVSDLTEATLSDLYTGPCRPPYLCDFVFDVAVLASVDTKTETGAAPTTDASGAMSAPENLDATGSAR